MQVAFFKGRHPGIKGWLGVMTKWWTRGPYSHGELVIGYMPDGRAICWSSTYLDGGVRRALIALDPTDWDVMELDVTDAQREVAVQWFREREGQKYDVLGLFGFLWRHEEGDKDKWFCTEAVAEALGLPESWRKDPNSFAAELRGDVRAKQPITALA
jgi:hypothetical protein